MLIDAVLPGRERARHGLRRRARGRRVRRPGRRRSSDARSTQGLPAYVAVALAGTIGYTIGAIVGWAIGLYGGRPYLERHGRWLHLEHGEARSRRALVRALGGLGRLPRPADAGRPLVRLRSRPASSRSPFVRYTLLTLLGSAIWCFALRRRRLGSPGRAGRTFHHAFRYVDYVDRGGGRRGGGVARLAVREEAPSPARPGVFRRLRNVNPELHSPA